MERGYVLSWPPAPASSVSIRGHSAQLSKVPFLYWTVEERDECRRVGDYQVINWSCLWGNYNNCMFWWEAWVVCHVTLAQITFKSSVFVNFINIFPSKSLFIITDCRNLLFPQVTLENANNFRWPYGRSQGLRYEQVTWKTTRSRIPPHTAEIVLFPKNH